MVGQQLPHVPGVRSALAKTQDLVVLGGKSGDGQGLELGEIGEGGVPSGHSCLAFGDLGLEPLDLGYPWVHRIVGFLEFP